MKARETLVTVMAFLAIGLTSFWAYRYEQRRQMAEMCPFCERMIHPATAFRIKVGDRLVLACCPRCGMHAELNRPPGQAVKAGEAWAKDIITGETVPAESAFYVEGGDVQYCTHGAAAMAREPQGVSVREYDRCLPTLVAFKTRQEAEAYQQPHGGRVLDFAQALAGVREQ